jgi:hypothetical protein
MWIFFGVSGAADWLSTERGRGGPTVVAPIYRARMSSRSPARDSGPLVLPGYTQQVKTAISLPDDLFERATRTAQERGISRSAFFADAARHYLETLEKSSLTAQINAALEIAGEEDPQDVAFRQKAARRVFDRIEW